MKTIRTSRGTYDAVFAWAPNYDGSCLMQLREDRRLPEVAAEFDGLDTVHYSDEEAEREYDWDGYNTLDSISRQQDGTCMIRLVREAENGTV